MATILFIHTNNGIYDSVKHAASQDAHTLLTASTVENLDGIYRDSPDLIILDSAVLYKDGLSACRRLRSVPDFQLTPILVLGNGQSPVEVAQVLDAGCDDCIRNLVPERELAARIRALLRRKPVLSKRLMLKLNAVQKSVQLENHVIDLTPTEYDLLVALCERPGQHLTTGGLLETVWHYPSGAGDPALVRNHIRNLRRKLEADPNHPRIVLCHQGRGYSVKADIGIC
jgi:two-component system response regulator MtrA